MRFEPDFRFAIIAADTYVTARLAELALSSIAGREEDVRTLVMDQLKRSGYACDEVEVDLAHQEIHFLGEEVPRLELYGILLMLFATYESVVKRLPSYVGNWSAADVTVVSGDGFISKATRFYGESLGVPLFSDGGQESFVRLVGNIRNAIGHATGHLAIVKAAIRSHLEAEVQKGGGLDVRDGYLHLAPQFVMRAASELDVAVQELINRLRTAYPNRM